MNFFISWVLDLFKKPELTVEVTHVKKVATKTKSAAKKSVKKPAKKTTKKAK